MDGATVRYYRKEIDRNRVEPIVLDLGKTRGFQVDVRTLPGEPDTPTNAIWVISRSATPDDVKIVAFNLIRVGVSLKRIGPYPFPGQILPSERDHIWIGADHALNTRQPLSVSDIAEANAFPTN